MRASVKTSSSASLSASPSSSTPSFSDYVPSCSYYDEELGDWVTDGLVIDSVEGKEEAEAAVAGGDAIDVNVSCFTFHLSDFAVATTDVESAFQPVPLVSQREKEGQAGTEKDRPINVFRF